MKRIMLHIIMPNQVSGPNNAALRIADSTLNTKYEFGFLTQTYHAGGKVNLRLIHDLKKQIREFNPDLLHLSGLQAAGFHAVLAARLAGYKNIMLTIRGFASDSIGLSKSKKFLFNNIFEPLTLMMSRRFYTVCSEAAEKPLIKRHINKFGGVIYNAAPEINLDYNKERNSFRNEIHAEDDAYLVAISGRMVYDKGITYIIEAIKRINDCHIKFIFIGDGKYLNIIQNDFQDEIKNGRIHLLGARKDVLRILCGCDLFLFATLHENLSNALLEAMSIGLPIIATNVGGNVEVVQDGINGYLIPSKDPVAIASKINMIKGKLETQKLFSKNSKKIIAEKFSQRIIYKEIDEAYKTMLINNISKM